MLDHLIIGLFHKQEVDVNEEAVTNGQGFTVTYKYSISGNVNNQLFISLTVNMFIIH